MNPPEPTRSACDAFVQALGVAHALAARIADDPGLHRHLTDDAREVVGHAQGALKRLLGEARTSLPN